MVPPPEKCSSYASSSDGNTRHYTAYFHALLQNTGASTLELVRDDAMLSDALDQANFLLGTMPSSPAVTVELDGIPSRPCRKPSAENLLTLLSQHHSITDSSNKIDATTAEMQPSSPSERLASMRSWSSERAQRKSLTSFLDEAIAPIPCDRHGAIPESPSMKKGKGMPFRKTVHKRRQCRWSASAIPTALGKSP